MDPVVVGALSSVVVCVMILLGMHVGVSLALTSVIGVYFISGGSMSACACSKARPTTRSTTTSSR